MRAIVVFEILAKLFGRRRQAKTDPETLSKFRQLRERTESEEPVDDKRRDLLIRMRGMELQTGSIVRRQHANGADEATPPGAASAERTDNCERFNRDVTGRKGF